MQRSFFEKYKQKWQGKTTDKVNKEVGEQCSYPHTEERNELCKIVAGIRNERMRQAQYKLCHEMPLEKLESEKDDACSLPTTDDLGYTITNTWCDITTEVLNQRRRNRR